MDFLQKNWENLANAIIVQAADDYRWARRQLKEDPYCLKAIRMIKEVEPFFVSDWFRTLTDADGWMILSKLREEFDG